MDRNSENISVKHIVFYKLRNSIGKHGAVEGNQGVPGVEFDRPQEEMAFEPRLKDKGASHSRLQCEKGNTLCSGYFMENSSQKKCRECWEPQRLERRSQHLQKHSLGLPPLSHAAFCVCVSAFVCHVCGVSSLSLYQQVHFSSCMWIFSVK